MLIALIAASLALKPATAKRTWGYKRAEIIAAAGQAALLLGVGGFVIVEGIRRLFDPPEVGGATMLWFGIIGLAGNIIGLIVLASGRNHNFNMKAAFLEVLNDALGSVAVIVAAIIIALTGWVQADAVVSLFIGVLIIPRTLKLLRDTVNVLMENAPQGLDMAEVREHILALPHVIDVHDLHASLVASGTPVLSAHVTVEDSCMTDGHAATILAELQRCVAEHFDVSVEHSTFQIEPAAHRDQEKARLVIWILLGAIIAAGVIWYAVFSSTKPAPAPPQPAASAELVREDSHRVTSPATEKAQLVEFLDFECESCRAAQPLVEELKKEYGDQITFVNRYFPLPGHRNSGTAALAVEAAAQQGQFEQMYARMFETQPQWGEKQDSQAPLFRTYAQELGLDLAKYDAAVADEKTIDRIRKDVADGRALGMTGTPTFFLNGEKLVLKTEADFRQKLTDAAK